MGIIKLQLGSLSPQHFKSELPEVSYIESQDITTTFNTGFNSTEIVEIPCNHPEIDDSIIDSIDTGFGNGNIIIQECPKPEYKTPLYKENHLIEFNSDTEKELVRQNLNVYSKKEVNNLISHIIVGDTQGNFITKDEVQVMLDEYVASTHSTYALYDIPNNLFPL